jgi:NinB protein
MTQWSQIGETRMSDAQQRMLNAVCGDLSAQMEWHNFRLSKDDWRHLLSGTVLGWRVMRGIDRGEGSRSLIMLGGSSLNLTKTMAADAITQALLIGDHPETQGLNCRSVRWSDKVLLGLGLSSKDIVA